MEKHLLVLPLKAAIDKDSLLPVARKYLYHLFYVDLLRGRGDCRRENKQRMNFVTMDLRSSILFTFKFCLFLYILFFLTRGSKIQNWWSKLIPKSK